MPLSYVETDKYMHKLPPPPVKKQNQGRAEHNIWPETQSTSYKAPRQPRATHSPERREPGPNSAPPI